MHTNLKNGLPIFILLLYVGLAQGDCTSNNTSKLNMLANPGFEAGNEMPTEWTAPQDSQSLFSRDTSVSHSGNASLRWENTDPNIYQLLTQNLNLEPGRMYELSAWIKTENLHGIRESGAAICLGLHDQEGNHVNGGPHPGGQKGTRDWWPLTAYCGPMSENCPQGSFTCYVRKNQGKTFTGTAWWDDLCFRPVSFYSRMLQPQYKRSISDKNSTVVFEFETYPEDYGFAFSEITSAIDVLDADGKLVQNTVFDIENRLQRISLDLADLQSGHYTLVTKLLCKQSREELWRWEYAVQYEDTRTLHRRVNFDPQGRTLIDGTPFFPLGVYAREVPIDLLADSPFNCYLSYYPQSIQQMNAAHSAGLMVIYSVKDYFNKIWHSPGNIRSVHDEIPALKKTIRAFRNHPALLAWYTNDELGPDALPQHWAHYETISQEDPDHPAWSLHNKPEEMSILMNTCDVMGIDSYPIPPTQPLSLIAKDTRETVTGVRNSRPVWVVPTISNPATWGKENARPPTLEEMRCSSWLAICEGAKGLIYYALHRVQADTDPAYPFEQRWAEIKQMANEIDQRNHILLADSDCPEITVEADDWLHWTARTSGDTVYIIAVSDGNGAGQVSFTLNTQATVVNQNTIADNTNTAITCENGTWSGHLAENEVIIYTVPRSHQ